MDTDLGMVNHMQEVRPKGQYWKCLSTEAWEDVSMVVGWGIVRVGVVDMVIIMPGARRCICWCVAA